MISSSDSDDWNESDRLLEMEKEKNKELEDTKRAAKIIVPYLKLLEQQLDDKHLSFWTFPDRAGFKKIKQTNFQEIQKLVKSDVKSMLIEKYVNFQ